MMCRIPNCSDRLRSTCRTNSVFPDWSRWAIFCILLAPAAGCSTSTAEPTALPPPVVTVSLPVVREVADRADFTGRIEAIAAVDIRPRVSGYITKMPFVEGAAVKTGELLFQIDPRPYQAQVDQAKATLAMKKATLKLAIADNGRAKILGAKGIGAITVQDLESYQAREDQARAEVEAAQASLESAEINLAFCQITAPISGRVSRYYLTIGNLVNADSTLLTTIVSEDPIYAYFDVDELTLLVVQRRLMDAPLNEIIKKQFPVYMGLADENGYPHKGFVDFTNNVVTSSTGTLTVRAVFPNPPSPTGRFLLKAGMFARIRLPISMPHQAVLVSDRALGSDQGAKFVYVVGADNVVHYQAVQVGALQDDGLRVVTEGLKPNERIVVDGLQLVRPKMTVTVDEQPMPTTGPAPGAARKPAVPKEPPADSTKDTQDETKGH
jgi:membrane fusion protein, multidrug efflux system